jgi:putative ABC transport system substrate-binding protein
VLWDTSGTAGQLRTVEQAGRSLALQLQVLKVKSPGDLESAFESAKKQRAEGMIMLASPILTAQMARLAKMTLRDRMPAIYYHEAFVDAGGLLAYGPRLSEFSWQRAAIYVDKILKGAKPADLLVEQPTKFDFVINLKTAKQIGVTIPQWILVKADRVIR